MSVRVLFCTWLLHFPDKMQLLQKQLMANNTNLGAAKAAKNDEFYTQYADIQKEVNAYLEYNPDTFRDKVVLLPCDDPEWYHLRWKMWNIRRMPCRRAL